jgi:hypothetical protein
MMFPIVLGYIVYVLHTKDFDGTTIISAYFKHLKKGSVALPKD